MAKGDGILYLLLVYFLNIGSSHVFLHFQEVLQYQMDVLNLLLRGSNVE